MIIPYLAQFSNYRGPAIYEELSKSVKGYYMNHSAYLAASLSNSARVGSVYTQHPSQNPIEDKGYGMEA